MIIFWLLVFTLLCLFFEYWYYSANGLRKVLYSQHFTEKSVFEGSQVELVEDLQNHMILPQPSLAAIYSLPQGASLAGSSVKHTSRFSIWGFSRIVRTNVVKCEKRCFHIPSTVVLESSDFFGLTKQNDYSYDTTGLIVYPRPTPWREMPFEAYRFGENVESRRFIYPDPLLIASIRPYSPTDHFRDIHWNASAHTGLLQTKIRSYESDPQIWIVLNTEFDSEEQEERVEQGIRMAAGLMEWAVAHGCEASFICNGSISGYFRNKPVKFLFSEMSRNGEQFLRFLAMLKTGRHCSLATVIKELEGVQTADIAVLSDVWDADCEYYQKILERNDCSVRLIPLEVRA